MHCICTQRDYDRPVFSLVLSQTWINAMRLYNMLKFHCSVKALGRFDTAVSPNAARLAKDTADTSFRQRNKQVMIQLTVPVMHCSV
jgi:hypothetical protein